MFGLDPFVKELREANKKLQNELETINETLDDLNHNMKLLIDIEMEKLPRKAQKALAEKWEQNTD